MELMFVEPKCDSCGAVVAQPWGGQRRIDRILVRPGLEARTTGAGYVTALAGLTDHIPVVTGLRL